MPTNRTPKYPGDLGKPLVRCIPEQARYTGFLGGWSPEQEEKYNADCRAEAKRVHAEWVRRLRLLMDHYHLEDGDYQRLAVHLIFAHVPGLQFSEPRQRRGAKIRWSFSRLMQLLEAVNRVREELGLKEKGACQFLATNKTYAADWGRPPNHKGNRRQWGNTLFSRLQDAKKAKRGVSISYLNEMSHFEFSIPPVKLPEI